MKRFGLLAFCQLALCSSAFAASCGSLAQLALPHGKITLAALQPAGSLGGLTPAPLENLPAFCRVAATLMPASDSNIRIEVWMPADGWNGRYEGTGNGGYAGAIGYGGLAAALRKGFAVATTDMGTYVADTSTQTGQNADALVGHPDRWQDWGSRSTHEMTVAAKQIIRAYYDRKPDYSYFVGCSTGGQQALVEAQRFPNDYDGILSGAPANNRTHLHMGFIWALAAAEQTPESRIPEEKIPLISQAVLNACTAQKAVASDQFLSVPGACRWDPHAIQCKAGDGPDCLTAAQVTAAEKLYDGPRNPATHAQIYPGLTRGSEFNWEYLMPPGGPPRYDSLFKWTFGASWDWHTFDFNHDVAAVDAKLAANVNAVSPDLSIFKKHGHKLLAYHGWADVVVPSLESLNYLASVQNAQESAARRDHLDEFEETEQFYRLFMIPGMAHCSGGPGLNTFDGFDALETWVEKDVAPETLVARRIDKGKTVMTRPVCVFPKTARYNGTGDPNDAASFRCEVPLY